MGSQCAERECHTVLLLLIGWACAWQLEVQLALSGDPFRAFPHDLRARSVVRAQTADSQRSQFR